jgi:hypothetical protein
MEGSKNANWYSRLAQGSPVIFLFFCLAASPSLVRHLWGRGWGVVAAVVVFAVWLTIRPWRFIGLPQDSKRSVFIVGTLSLAALVLVHGFFYWLVHYATAA